MLTSWRNEGEKYLPEDGQAVHEVVAQRGRGRWSTYRGRSVPAVFTGLIFVVASADGESLRELLLPRARAFENEKKHPFLEAPELFLLPSPPPPPELNKVRVIESTLMRQSDGRIFVVLSRSSGRILIDVSGRAYQCFGFRVIDEFDFQRGAGRGAYML